MTLTPYLTLSDATAAMEFYKKGLGAVEKSRMPAQDGNKILHAELEIAGGRLLLSDDFTGAPASPAKAAVFIGLDKASAVDALVAQAKAAGANVTRPPEDAFWGDRYAQFVDPFGHAWMIGAPKG
jgi:PhnB protein